MIHRNRDPVTEWTGPDKPGPPGVHNVAYAVISVAVVFGLTVLFILTGGS